MLIKKFTFILGMYSMRKARYLTARSLFLFVIMYIQYEYLSMITGSSTLFVLKAMVVPYYTTTYICDISRQTWALAWPSILAVGHW